MIHRHPRFTLTAVAERAEPDTDDAFRVAACDIAAEVRTLLKGLAEMVAWSADERDGEAGHDNILEVLTLRLARVDRLAADLQLLAQASQLGQVELINLDKLINDVLDTIPKADTFRISQKLESPEVLFDRTQMFVLLYCVLSNAIEHHDQVDGTLTLSAEASDAGYVMTIKDDGPGLGDLGVDDMLDPLVRSPTSGGTGMGLTIVQEIMRHAGASLSLRARDEGRGLCVTLRFPPTAQV